MLYALAVVAGIILGLLAEAWARGIQTPPTVSHERCDERYEALLHRYKAMQLQHARDISAREGEIQRLLHGAS